MTPADSLSQITIFQLMFIRVLCNQKCVSNGANSWLQELTPSGSKNENGIVASPQSAPVHLRAILMTEQIIRMYRLKCVCNVCVYVIAPFLLI